MLDIVKIIIQMMGNKNVKGNMFALLFINAMTLGCGTFIQYRVVEGTDFNSTPKVVLIIIGMLALFIAQLIFSGALVYNIYYEAKLSRQPILDAATQMASLGFNGGDASQGELSQEKTVDVKPKAKPKAKPKTIKPKVRSQRNQNP